MEELHFHHYPLSHKIKASTCLQEIPSLEEKVKIEIKKLYCKIISYDTQN